MASIAHACARPRTKAYCGQIVLAHGPVLLSRTRAISKQKNHRRRRRRLIMMIRIAINEFALAHFKCVFIQSGLIVSPYARTACVANVLLDKCNNPLNHQAYITTSLPGQQSCRSFARSYIRSLVCVCCENKHCRPFVRGHNRNNTRDSSAVANVVA